MSLTGVSDAADLIDKILQQDPNKRYTIPQILAHPWFTSPGNDDLTVTQASSKKDLVSADDPFSLPNPVPHPSPSTETVLVPQRPSQPETAPLRASMLGRSPSKSVSGSDTTTYHTAASELSIGSGASVSDDTQSDSRGLTTPTTSDGGPLGGAHEDDYPMSTAHKLSVDEEDETQRVLVGPLRRNESETTLRRIEFPRDPSGTPDVAGAPGFEAVPETEEDSQNEEILVPRKPPAKMPDFSPASVAMTKSPSGGADGLSSAGEESQLRAGPRNPPTYPPSSFPSRTPVRTKRRSVSSTLSPPASPTSPTHALGDSPVDYLAELTASVPVLFSTPLENELLENMSNLGLDASQIVHSVLSDACDSTGALWWMLRRKFEKKERSRVRKELEMSRKEFTLKEKEKPKRPAQAPDASKAKSKPEETPEGLGLDLSPPVPPKDTTPLLAFVPPTPTSTVPGGIKTPPPASPKAGYTPLSLSNSSLGRSLSPTLNAEASSSRSTPTTPGQTKRTRSETNKPRSGSVSILQRASTALGAAVLVRKKSEENPRDRLAAEESTTQKLTQAAARLTKLQPLNNDAPSERSSTTPTSIIPASPWVVTASAAGSKSAERMDTPEESPEDTLSSLPRIASSSKTRQRASLLTAFRTWFQDDRKKRKDPIVHHVAAPRRGTMGTPGSIGSARGRPRVVARGDSYKAQRRHHEHRVSVSSKHSSNANSRRSSVVSTHRPQLDGSIPITRQRSDASRRSVGSHTPTSERGEFSSRPSSVRSFSMTPVTPNMRRPRHSKSPSNSSAGSGHLRRAQSPLQQYHRRAGSGSSTKVIRQAKPVQTRHARSGSAASSIRSVPNSRPTSFHEGLMMGADSDVVMTSYSNSPEPRRAQYTPTSFVAQKKPVTYAGVARTHWKKSWGSEPPGWSSKVVAHAPPREAESPSSTSTSSRANLRDVFTGRPSLSPDDEDEWTDEEEFLGGFGQNRVSSGKHGLPKQLVTENTSNQAGVFTGSPTLRRTELPSGSGGPSLRVNTQKRVNRLSPLQNTLGLPPATTTQTTTEVLSEPENAPALQRTASGRRGNIQAGRAPALRSTVIQEEDEDEEE